MNMRQRKHRINTPLLMRGKLMKLRGLNAYAYWGHFKVLDNNPTHSRRNDKSVTIMWNMTARYK